MRPNSQYWWFSQRPGRHCPFSQTSRRPRSQSAVSRQPARHKLVWVSHTLPRSHWTSCEQRPTAMHSPLPVSQKVFAGQSALVTQPVLRWQLPLALQNSPSAQAWSVAHTQRKVMVSQRSKS